MIGMVIYSNQHLLPLVAFLSLVLQKIDSIGQAPHIMVVVDSKQDLDM